MAAFTDHYRTLGVHRLAEQAVIEAAYRALARRYHPDLNPGDSAANARLRRINEAYIELSDPGRRGAYDLAWDAHHRRGSASPKQQTRSKAGHSPGPATSAKPSPSGKAPPPRGSGRTAGRPWYVNVVAVGLLLLLLRGGADLLTRPDSAAITQETQPARISPTATAIIEPAATRQVARGAIPGVVLSRPSEEPTEPPRRNSGSLLTGYECDPAYPDENTCIRPGPPFKQGCAITDQRRFTVLPPDPQGLDHDGDGIGCEPILAAPKPAAPMPQAPQAPAGNCHPSYPDVCISPSPPDLDCRDIPRGDFRVVGSDPHRLDGPYDGSNPYEPDGRGCELN